MSTVQKNSTFDVTQKFVRVMSLRSDGFVLFEFAVGQPEICAEMILPRDGFIDFCTEQEVRFLPKRDADHAHKGSDGLGWQLSDMQKHIKD